MRAKILATTPRPRGFDAKLVQALAALQTDRLSEAHLALVALDKRFPYAVEVLVGLARVHADHDAWDQALDAAIRALTVEPESRAAWWWTGVAFSQLEERSSAVASFHNLVSLSGDRAEGIAFLRARRGEPGMEERLQRAIDQALTDLGKR